ncbi:MAG: hypothetical protein ACUZ8H_12510 [Candidatus Anammoxibacter sp.]
MRKHIKKIVLILMISIFALMAIVATFEYLISRGNFTTSIEHQINKRIDGRITIGSIYIDSMSGIVLKQITFRDSANMKHLDFKCNSLSIKYSLWGLLKKHVKEIEIVDPELNINLLSNTGISISTENITLKQQGNKLSSERAISFNIFGGNIVINNLLLSNIMSSSMEIAFSADVNDLDLEQMSNTFTKWGYVTGILNGKITNIKIAAGTPSSFEVELKTVKRQHVKQIVNTTFLKTFVPGVETILDTNGLPYYMYVIIGLNAKLENDYITFKGAVRENGKELFMKGAGTKKINIVFNNPAGKIEFKNFPESFASIMDLSLDDTQVNIK